MAIAVGDIYRAVIEWRLQEQQCYTVLHTEATGALSAGASITAQLQNIRDSLLAIAGAILQGSTDQLKLTKVSTFAIYTTADPHGNEWEQASEGADDTNDPMPGFVAAVLWHTSGLVGRSNRGRSHILGLTEDHCEGGRLSTAGETHLTSVQAAYANNWGQEGAMRACIFSKTRFAVDPTTAATPILGYDWSPVLGSMYSRRLGIGQ